MATTAAYIPLEQLTIHNDQKGTYRACSHQGARVDIYNYWRKALGVMPVQALKDREKLLALENPNL